MPWSDSYNLLQDGLDDRDPVLALNGDGALADPVSSPYIFTPPSSPRANATARAVEQLGSTLARVPLAAAVPVALVPTPPPPPPQLPAAAGGSRGNATFNKIRCSGAVFAPGAVFGFCGFCEKLLVYRKPTLTWRGERPTWFGDHRGKSKKAKKPCPGTNPAFYEHWRREDTGKVERTSGRAPPPPLSALVRIPGA